MSTVLVKKTITDLPNSGLIEMVDSLELDETSIPEGFRENPDGITKVARTVLVDAIWAKVPASSKEEPKPKGQNKNKTIIELGDEVKDKTAQTKAVKAKDKATRTKKTGKLDGIEHSPGNPMRPGTVISAAFELALRPEGVTIPELAVVFKAVGINWKSYAAPLAHLKKDAGTHPAKLRDSVYVMETGKMRENSKVFRMWDSSVGTEGKYLTKAMVKKWAA